VPEGDEETDDDKTERSSVISGTPDVESALREKLSYDEDDDDDDEKVASAKQRLEFLGNLSSLDRGESADSVEGTQQVAAQTPTETTGLLAAAKTDDSSSDDDDERVPPTKNEEVLKPSIFTHLGDLGSRSRNPYYS
jgi:hypothetical protein